MVAVLGKEQVTGTHRRETGRCGTHRQGRTGREGTGETHMQGERQTEDKTEGGENARDSEEVERGHGERRKDGEREGPGPTSSGSPGHWRLCLLTLPTPCGLRGVFARHCAHHCRCHLSTHSHHVAGTVLPLQLQALPAGCVPRGWPRPTSPTPTWPSPLPDLAITPPRALQGLY